MAKRGSHGIVEEKSRKKRKAKQSYSEKHRDAIKNFSTDNSLSYRERREISQNTNTLTEHNRVRNTRKKREKQKGKVIIVLVAILAVLIALCVGIYLYLSGVSNRNFETPVKGTQTETTTEIHQTLVVVTVTEKTITYNGEDIASPLELERRLSAEDNPTLSLVNIDADIDTYNSVAEVLNKYGGTYEMMDMKNTNPSIHTTDTTTNTSQTSVTGEE